MKFLVVETECDNGHKYTHFIELRKDVIFDEIKSFMSHLDYFKGQKVTKCYFSNTRMSNW